MITFSADTYSCCRFVLRIVCCALGIIIEENQNDCNRDKHARFLVSNHLSLFDCIPIHLLTNCQTVSYPPSWSGVFCVIYFSESSFILQLVYCNLPDWLLHGIGLKSIPSKVLTSGENTRLTILRSECKEHKESILMFPEMVTTNGEAGLLKWGNEIVDNEREIVRKCRWFILSDVSFSGSTVGGFLKSIRFNRLRWNCGGRRWSTWNRLSSAPRGTEIISSHSSFRTPCLPFSKKFS